MTKLLYPNSYHSVNKKKKILRQEIYVAKEKEHIGRNSARHISRLLRDARSFPSARFSFPLRPSYNAQSDLRAEQIDLRDILKLVSFFSLSLHFVFFYFIAILVLASEIHVIVSRAKDRWLSIQYNVL